MNRRALGIGLVLLLAGATAIYWWSARDQPHPNEVVTRPAAPPAVTRSSKWPPDTASIPAMLRDPSWKVRLGAANALRDLHSMSKSRRAELLLGALDREAAAPDSGTPVVGSYVPLTSFLRLQYVGLMEDLGPQVSGAVRSAPAPATPAGQEWRALALAATGVPDAAPMIRPLVTGSSDFSVRMLAAHLLGDLKDRDAVPHLTAALRDSARTGEVSDLSGSSEVSLYPVRESAAGALRELGVAVERRGSSFVVK
jgi:HEAT repeat protein